MTMTAENIDRPSIFVLLAEDQLQASLRGAVRFVIKVKRYLDILLLFRNQSLPFVSSSVFDGQVPSATRPPEASLRRTAASSRAGHSVELPPPLERHLHRALLLPPAVFTCSKLWFFPAESPVIHSQPQRHSPLAGGRLAGPLPPCKARPSPGGGQGPGADE